MSIGRKLQKFIMCCLISLKLERNKNREPSISVSTILVLHVYRTQCLRPKGAATSLCLPRRGLEIPLFQNRSDTACPRVQVISLFLCSKSISFLNYLAEIYSIPADGHNVTVGNSGRSRLCFFRIVIMTDCAHLGICALYKHNIFTFLRCIELTSRQRRRRRPGTVVARLLIFGFETPSQEPKHPRTEKHGQG